MRINTSPGFTKRQDEKNGAWPTYRETSRWRCLSLFRLPSQNATDWGWGWLVNKRSLFSQFWQVQDQGTGRLGVRWGLPSQFLMAVFLLYPRSVEGAGKLSAVSFTRTPIPLRRASPSWLFTSQRPHLLVSSPWGLGFNTGALWWGGHKYSVHSKYYTTQLEQC